MKIKKLKFASNGKRDIHGVEDDFDHAFEKLEMVEKWKYDTNRKIVLKYLKACKKGEAKSAEKNKRIGKATLYRVSGILRLLSEKWIKKDFDKTTKDDWDKFYEAMEEDKILNDHGKKYKATTKSKNYKTVRKFLKYTYGSNKNYPDFCDTWVTTEETPTKDFLTRTEVERMINAAGGIKMRCFLQMLFDGGFRIEEIGNLRWKDVSKPDGKDYYKVHVRKETTKTKQERYVSLMLSTDFIESYKNSEIKRLNGKFEEANFLFENEYGSFLKSVKRIGKKVLNKDISPHTMRHSSATYFASIIKTYQQFCSKYGWKLRAGTAQRYFHSIDDDAIADQSKDHEIARFKTEFETVKLQNKHKDDRIEKLEKDMKNQKEDMDKLLERFNLSFKIEKLYPNLEVKK